MTEINTNLSVLIKALEDSQATNIVAIDVIKQTTITDYMIICTGRASRHVKAIAEHIMLIMKQAGLSTLHVSGLEHGDWVLVDLGDFIVHIMQADCRIVYNLEGLWQDNTTKHDKIA